jgi:hypothetical protein
MNKLRIEYVRLRRGGDEGAFSADVIMASSAQAIEVEVGVVSAIVATAPAFAADRNYNEGVFARITALRGASLVSVGADPLASVGTGVGVTPGRPICLPISAGQKVAAIVGTSSVNAPAARVDRSGLVNVAGQPQPIAPADPAGYDFDFQNQSDTGIWLRWLGGNAGKVGGSLYIDAGRAWSEQGVTAELSAYCDAAGKAFFLQIKKAG